MITLISNIPHLFGSNTWRTLRVCGFQSVPYQPAKKERARYDEVTHAEEAAGLRATLSQADVIIVGNHRGAGVSHVRALDESTRERVLVVFNIHLSIGDLTQYTELGITPEQIIQRNLLLRHLLAMAETRKCAPASNNVPDEHPSERAIAV